jgi:hypothetical protein
MKRLHFQTSNNLSLLHDEIMAAIPALAQKAVPGELSPDGGPLYEPVMTVEGRDDDIWLTVPDDTDEAAVATVIAAHDASAVQTSTSAEAKVTGATKLKALGLTDDEIAALQH